MVAVLKTVTRWRRCARVRILFCQNFSPEVLSLALASQSETLVFCAMTLGWRCVFTLHNAALHARAAAVHGVRRVFGPVRVQQAVLLGRWGKRSEEGLHSTEKRRSQTRVRGQNCSPVPPEVGTDAVNGFLGC